MAEGSTPQVLVVGAGPAGLILALSLVKQGISVRVVAKEKTYRPGRRGAGITPRTLEVFKILGVLGPVQKVADGAIPVTRYKVPGGTEALRTWMMYKLETETPDRPYVNAVFLGQDQLEEILREELSKFSCTVELGIELISLVQNEDHVEAVLRKTTEDGQETTETVQVPFLVGADGARGATRKQLNLDFIGETRDEQFMVGDVRLSGLGTTNIHMWSVEEPPVTIMIWPGQYESGDIFTIQMAGKDMERPRLISEHGYLEKYFHSKTDRTDIKFEEVLLVSEYNPNIRMVDKFGEGRVFLAGDSAHVHSLMGGQGLNSSVQDSFNLAWKLAYVIKGRSKPNLLSTYTEERLPVIAEMLNKTTEMHGKAFKAGGKFDDTSLRERNKSLDQLGVNYRWSSIVVQDDLTAANAELGAYGSDADAGPVAAGDRAPDAPQLLRADGKGSTLLYDLFAPDRDTILVFSPSSQQAPDLENVLSKLPKDMYLHVAIIPDLSATPGGNKFADGTAEVALIDAESHAHTSYGVKSGDFRIVVIRPDAVIGAIVKELDGLEKYYQGIQSSGP